MPRESISANASGCLLFPTNFPVFSPACNLLFAFNLIFKSGLFGFISLCRAGYPEIRLRKKTDEKMHVLKVLKSGVHLWAAAQGLGLSRGLICSLLTAEYHLTVFNSGISRKKYPL